MTKSFVFPVRGTLPMMRILAPGQVGTQREPLPDVFASKYVRCLLALCAVCAALWLTTTAVLTLIQRMSPASTEIDAFSEWLNVSEISLEALALSCSAASADSTRKTCYLYPDDGRIAQVRVSVRYGSMHQIQIIPRSHAVTLGDLIGLWGRPEVERSGETARFWWQERELRAVSEYVPRPISYHTVIGSISREYSGVGNGDGAPQIAL